jgi:hypothetical protein
VSYFDLVERQVGALELNKEIKVKVKLALEDAIKAQSVQV